MYNSYVAFKCQGDNNSIHMYVIPLQDVVYVLYFKCNRTYIMILLAPSGTLVFIMVYYIPAGHFSKFFKFGTILPIYIHTSLSLSFSVDRTEPGNTFA